MNRQGLDDEVKMVPGWAKTGMGLWVNEKEPKQGLRASGFLLRVEEAAAASALILLDWVGG